MNRMPWSVLWCVKGIIEGHPGCDDEEWLAETQRLNDEGRLELRKKRFYYKLPESLRGLVAAKKKALVSS